MNAASPTGVARLLPEQPFTSLRAYLDAGGGRGLDVALGAAPDKVIDVVEAAGLRGRGGAGFPTGSKWRSIVDTARADDLLISVVVNGAEGEPGTYKDRALLVANPYQVVEGLLIACHAVNARRAYVGVKASFHEPRQRLEDALAEATAAAGRARTRWRSWPAPMNISLARRRRCLR